MTTRPSTPPIVVRPTGPEDFQGITALCLAVYPKSPPWTETQLTQHLVNFPDGQLVAALEDSGKIVGMAASLIVRWDDYEPSASWRGFTARGTFDNHDPAGRTLYGAEVMVHPEFQRRRIGKRLYEARRGIARRLGLRRIRAGARLRGYHRHAATMSPTDYVRAVVRGALRDATLSFQLREGFQVFGVVEGYLGHDPDSLGWAALIEWVNEEAKATGPRRRYIK